MAHRALEQFCRKNVELGADQPLKAVSRDYQAVLVRYWKRSAEKNVDMEDQLMKFQKEARALLGFGLASIHVVMTARVWPHSACFLKTGAWLDSEETD